MLESLKTELGALLNGLARLREDFTRRFPLKNCMFRGLRNRLTVKILIRFFIFSIFLMKFSSFAWFYMNFLHQRASKELCCLDDGSLALPLDEAVQALAPLLLVASEVQAVASKIGSHRNAMQMKEKIRKFNSFHLYFAFIE